MNKSRKRKRLIVLFLDLICAVVCIIMATFWMSVLEDVALQLYTTMPHAMPLMVLALGAAQSIPCIIGIVLCSQSNYCGDADDGEDIDFKGVPIHVYTKTDWMPVETDDGILIPWHGSNLTDSQK